MESLANDRQQLKVLLVNTDPHNGAATGAATPLVVSARRCSMQASAIPAKKESAMEFKKLSESERTHWAELVEADYDARDWHDLSKDDAGVLRAIMVDVLEEDFDWLMQDIATSPTAVARLESNAFFYDTLRRAYECGVACNHAGCYCNLANLYHKTDGSGSEQDYAIAVELYEKGSDLGDSQASVNLGYIYYYGRGCAVDYTKAYECYSRAALACEHPEALYKLGDLYAVGKGVRQSDWMAWLMYSKAYEKGKGTVFECRAAHHVADMLMTGIEGKLDKDPQRALKLYTEAEISYYDAIDEGLHYYRGCLRKAIEGQQKAREEVVRLHEKIRRGERN